MFDSKKFLVFLLFGLFLIGCKSSEPQVDQNDLSTVTVLESYITAEKDIIWDFKSSIITDLLDQNFLCVNNESVGSVNTERTECYKPKTDSDRFKIFRIDHILTRSESDPIIIRIFEALDDPKRYGLNITYYYSIDANDVKKFNDLIMENILKYSEQISTDSDKIKK